MRASPAFQITLEHFGAWRAALLMLMVLAAAALFAWWMLDAGARLHPMAAVLAIVSACTLCASATSWRCASAHLRWDGQFWYLASPPHHPEVRARRLDVALDLGSWMLLRFERDSGPWTRRVNWVPAQRLGHAFQWHALRCAVYCARPAPGPDPGSPAGDQPESKQ
jgi:hypothetical protein